GDAYGELTGPERRGGVFDLAVSASLNASTQPLNALGVQSRQYYTPFKIDLWSRDAAEMVASTISITCSKFGDKDSGHEKDFSSHRIHGAAGGLRIASRLQGSRD